MGKMLVVAEKPSVGRDIARVLHCADRGAGCLIGEQYVVTWAIGHLVSLCEPDELDAKYKRWNYQTLPMLPETIPLKVLPGAEVFAHPDNLRTLLAHRRLVTLNHSHYLLVEFDFGSPGDEITRLLGMIAEYGLTPVVAHPERYDAVQAAPELAMHWFSEGCLLQLNKGSLLHRLGDGAYETSMLLLRRGFADVIASDAHDTYYRPSGFQSLLPVLERYCAPAYVRLLLEQNPARILSDRRISRKIEDPI